MQKLKKSCADLVKTAREKIVEIDTQTLLDMHGNPDLVIVDLRDVRERKKFGCIPGSYHAPRGMIEFWVDPESPYHKDIFSKPNTEYVFHCASGWRSALTVATLQDMGFEACHLKEGFNSWKAAGGPIEI